MRLESIARGLLNDVALGDHRLFLQGCDLEDGGAELAREAISRGEWSWLDSRADVPRILGPLRFVHGAEDDVIPVEQADALLAACTAAQDAKTLITGLYGHSEHTNDDGPKGGRLSEALTMWAIVDGMMHITEHAEDQARSR